MNIGEWRGENNELQNNRQREILQKRGVSPFFGGL